MVQTRHPKRDDDAGPTGWRIWTNDVVGRERRAIRQHCHDVHEVVWGATGTRTVEIGPDTWIIPPTIGVLIPAGTPHSGHVAAGAAYRCTLIDPTITGGSFDEPVAIAVTPAWREVVLRLRDHELPAAPRRRIEQAAVDLTEPVATPSIILPLPRDPRLREIAHELITNPAAPDDLVSWGRLTGASARTITRRFTAETGLTFAEWRTHARIRAALVHLAAGTSVAQVARLVGFHTTSAFVKAFRLTTGQTPGAFATGTSTHAIHLGHTGDDDSRSLIEEKLAPA